MVKTLFLLWIFGAPFLGLMMVAFSIHRPSGPSNAKRMNLRAM